MVLWFSFYFPLGLNSPTHVKCHDSMRYVTPQGGHFQHVEAGFGSCPLFHSCLFSFFFFLGKTAPVFEQAKTSGCTLANHVISERIYPNKAQSNTIPLWLPNGFCIIHLDPYNNSGSLGAIFRFPRFACRDTTLSGWERSFSLRADVTCTNKHSWVWCLIAKIRYRTFSKCRFYPWQISVYGQMKPYCVWSSQ